MRSGSVRRVLARGVSRVGSVLAKPLAPVTRAIRRRWQRLPPWARRALLAATIPVPIVILVLLGPTLCVAMGPACIWGVGAANTFILFVGAAGLGLVIGFLVGWGRSSGIPIISLPLLAYVEGLRGIPRLAIVLLAIFFFPRVGLGLDWAVLWGILALGVSSGAYQGEVFRSGFESVARGQVDAATSLGMTYAQTMQYVTLPQVIRTILPPLGNEWIITLKDTSLLIALPAIVGFAIPDNFELTAVARFLQRDTPIVALWPLFFVGAAAVYLAFTVAISKTIQWVEERFQVPGLGVTGQ